MGAGTLQSDWDTKPTPPPRTSNNSRPILLWFVQSMNQTRKLVRSMDPMPCLRSAPFMLVIFTDALDSHGQYTYNIAILLERTSGTQLCYPLPGSSVDFLSLESPSNLFHVRE